MATPQAGRKRKRDEGPEENLNARIGGKIHHEKKLVHRACKKAKLFEIQKVVQKLKNERKKNAEYAIISTYEAQLSCLKTVNDDAIGNSAFRSKILKDRILRTNETLLPFVKDLDTQLPGSVEPGSTLAKIQSRLQSSKVLSAQIAASVESLKILINPALKSQKDQSSDGEAQTPQKSKGKHSSHQSTLFNEDEESPSPMAEESGWESGTVDIEDDIAVDTVWESEDRSSRPPGSPHRISDSDAQAEMDEYSDVSGYESMNGPVVTNDDRQKKVKKTSSSITESTFLPSLSVGFIQGSDGSDFGEAEMKEADMPKKNRRGQRARRAIWEKKYGRHANHKKKEAEERAAAFARKVAKAQTPKTYDAQRPTISGQRKPSDVREGNLSRSTDDKPLHPSWEAKRKQKDKEQGSIVPSQGKKIKF